MSAVLKEVSNFLLMIAWEVYGGSFPQRKDHLKTLTICRLKFVILMRVTWSWTRVGCTDQSVHHHYLVVRACHLLPIDGGKETSIIPHYLMQWNPQWRWGERPSKDNADSLQWSWGEVIGHLNSTLTFRGFSRWSCMPFLPFEIHILFGNNRDKSVKLS